jgi:hypothetical protein
MVRLCLSLCFDSDRIERMAMTFGIKNLNSKLKIAVFCDVMPCSLVQVSEESGTNGNCIYYLHYMLYMFTPTLHARSQPLYHVCADFAQHIGIDSSTTVYNSLPKVTKPRILTAYTIPDDH